MDLKSLLLMMMDKRGQVLHLVGGSPPLMKAIHGALEPLVNEPLSVADVKQMLESILSPDQKTTLERDKEINSAYSLVGVSRFRLSVFYQRGTVAGILRLTPPTPQTLEALGLPSILKESASKPQGLILIIGPKGSGKSQTIAAILDYLLETKSVQIVSLENPIEFLLKNKKGVIYQREVGTDVTSFKHGLYTALRQDPDVLALSDLPDFSTIASVTSAAATGQLVIASMTANGVVMAFEHMMEFVPPYLQQALRSQIAAGLELAISQLLLTKKNEGLVLAPEILIGIPQSRNLIRDGKLPQLVQCMNSNRDLGMTTQELALRNLLKKNLIEPEEAIAKAVRPEELRRLVSLPV